MGAGDRPNVILFFFKIFVFALGRSTAPTRPPQRDFIFLKKFFIRVGAVATAPTHRANEIFFLSFFYVALGRVLFL